MQLFLVKDGLNKIKYLSAVFFLFKAKIAIKMCAEYYEWQIIHCDVTVLAQSVLTDLKVNLKILFHFVTQPISLFIKGVNIETKAFDG